MLGRLRSLRRLLKRQGVEGLLITNLSNIRYLSGFTGSSALLLVLQDEAVLFTDFRYKEQVKEETENFCIRIIRKSLIEDVACSNSCKNLGTVGFEPANLTFASYSKLKELLPKTEFVSCDSLVESLRARKDASELRRIRRAVAIADSAFEHVLGILKPGVRELDLAAEIEYLFKLKGGTAPSFPTIVASGTRSALPHARASRKRIRSGELVLFDMGTVHGGYCSDLTRTVVLGRAKSKQKRIYNLVLNAQKRAIASLRIGMKLSTLDGKARALIRDAGYGSKFGHGLGHGVGLEVHELPRVFSKSKEVARQGMVFTIEPGVYLPGWGGVRIEDMVAITADGRQVLTQSPKELIEL